MVKLTQGRKRTWRYSSALFELVSARRGVLLEPEHWLGGRAKRVVHVHRVPVPVLGKGTQMQHAAVAGVTAATGSRSAGKSVMGGGGGGMGR